MKVVLVTGGFDPLHSGHIEYFKAAKELGDILCVGVNSDDWLKRKKGKAFMPFNERKSIVENIKCVGNAFAFNDDDDSAIQAIEHIRKTFPRNTEIIFANGGDRTKYNIPEMVYEDVSFVFGIGGENKKNSSSWILKEWSQPTTKRAWGEYTVLDEGNGWKTKQLAFHPHQSLSDQKHLHRSEHWHIVEGIIRIQMELENGDTISKTYVKGNSIDIPVNTWHKAYNVGTEVAKVIEVWIGEELSESDIIRRD